MKSCIIQPSNLWLIVIKLLLGFVIFTITHHPFQFIIIIVTMMQLICDY
jgi:hypothetical protein